jgi:hypothetical protein
MFGLRNSFREGEALGSGEKVVGTCKTILECEL